MSSSTRSKAGSPDSLRDGDASDAKARAKDDDKPDETEQPDKAGRSVGVAHDDQGDALGAVAKHLKKQKLKDESRSRAKDSGDAVEIELEMSRQRQIGWTVFGIILGSLLVWKLGTVGVWVGIVLIAIGLWRAFQ